MTKIPYFTLLSLVLGVWLLWLYFGSSSSSPMWQVVVGFLILNFAIETGRIVNSKQEAEPVMCKACAI